MAAQSSGARGPADALRIVARAPGYTVATYRNVMILHVDGAIDRAFLRAALAGHHDALRFEPKGYGVITLVEPSARIPDAEIRDEASKLRGETQHMLRVQSVLIGGSGFFASTMRAVITGIVTLARSRVPLKMVGDTFEAASFVADKLSDPDLRTMDLVPVLDSLRSPR